MASVKYFIVCFSLLFLLHVRVSSGVSEYFKKAEDQMLKLLSDEASATGFPFEKVWKQSELKTFYQEFEQHDNVPDLESKYRDPEILNMAEIRILVSYCIDDPPFYQDLNRDLRLSGGQNYPKSKMILRSAINKLAAFQRGTPDGLPKKLYRNEGTWLFRHYQKLFSTSGTGTLNQFTSTSRSFAAAKNFDTDDDRTVIVFENPEVGADVDDFSIFDEFEVLLPFGHNYKVLRAELNNGKPNVTLNGPYKLSQSQPQLVGSSLFGFGTSDSGPSRNIYEGRLIILMVIASVAINKRWY